MPPPAVVTGWGAEGQQVGREGRGGGSTLPVLGPVTVVCENFMRGTCYSSWLKRVHREHWPSTSPRPPPPITATFIVVWPRRCHSLSSPLLPGHAPIAVIAITITCPCLRVTRKRSVTAGGHLTGRLAGGPRLMFTAVLWRTFGRFVLTPFLVVVCHRSFLSEES